MLAAPSASSEQQQQLPRRIPKWHYARCFVALLLVSVIYHVTVITEDGQDLVGLAARNKSHTSNTGSGENKGSSQRKDPTKIAIRASPSAATKAASIADAELVESNKNVESLVPSSTVVSNAAAEEAYERAPAWMQHVTFMVLGAQKSGSSSLYHYMKQNRHIVTKLKETHCFESNWNSSDPKCENYLRVAQANQTGWYAVGDFTPSYLLLTDKIAESHVARYYPWVKLIAVLRDPLSRAYSHYQMRFHGLLRVGRVPFETELMRDLFRLKECGLLPHWEFKNETPTTNVQDWLSIETNQVKFERWFGSPRMVKAWQRYLRKGYVRLRSNYLSRGLYAVQILRWMSVFPRSRFMFLKTSHLSGDELQVTCDRVFDFISVPRATIASSSRIHNRRYEPMENATRELLYKLFRPFDEQLPKILGKEWSGPNIYD